jgi:hypothetical protein
LKSVRVGWSYFAEDYKEHVRVLVIERRDRDNCYCSVRRACGEVTSNYPSYLLSRAPMSLERKAAASREYNQKYRAEHRERYRELDRASQTKNAGKRKERARLKRLLNAKAVRSADARWRNNNKERVKEIRHRYNERNRDRIRARQAEQRSTDSYREQRREWYAANRQRILSQKASARYGIPASDIARMYQEQGGLCAGCRGEFRRTPQIDHDHRTGAVRGLLCFRCNAAIGCVDDSPARLRMLADYVERAPLKSGAA